MDQPQPKLLTTLHGLQGSVLDGRYQLHEVLGEGGMGVVFRATQLSVGRPVALKLLKLDQFGNPDSFERFRREIAIISALSHPNIVRLLDSGEDRALGLFYLAMELIEGVSLGDLLYERCARMKPELALEIVYQLLAALTEPHQHGIIHRDIKPDNLLLSAMSDDTVRVKVVDFGIARACDAGQRVTATGVLVGTPSYMAPELCRGSGELGVGTDLYAVGVLLYELLTGEVPFEAETAMGVLMRHLTEPPPQLSARLPDMPYPEIQGLIESLLAKDIQDRPQDAREVLRRIDAIRDAHRMPRVRVDSHAPPHAVFNDWLRFDVRRRAQMVGPNGTTAQLSGRDSREFTPDHAKHATNPNMPELPAPADRSQHLMPTRVGVGAAGSALDPTHQTPRPDELRGPKRLLLVIGALLLIASALAAGLVLDSISARDARPTTTPTASTAGAAPPKVAPTTPEQPEVTPAPIVLAPALSAGQRAIQGALSDASDASAKATPSPTPSRRPRRVEPRPRPTAPREPVKPEPRSKPAEPPPKDPVQPKTKPSDTLDKELLKLKSL